MGVKALKDLVAFQRAVLLRDATYALVQAFPSAERDFRWKSQLFEAVSGVAASIAEGWARGRPKEFCQFLRYASGSLDEAWTWLEDGVARGYYPARMLEPLRVHERICGAAIRRLRESLENR